MAKHRRSTLIDQIRQAIIQSDLTRYQISQQTGVDQASLSRFVHGERGLSGEAINAIGDLLNLEIVVREKKRRK